MEIIKRWCKIVLLPIFFILFISLPVYSYNNDNQERTMSGGPHRTINYYAIKRFLDNISHDTVFKRYDFMEGNGLNGIAVIQPGAWMEDIQEAERKGKWYQWVIEGGYSADEPESYMALRHFFDPTGANQGANYLTDHVDEMLGSMAMGRNPKMDAKWWGAMHSRYSINKGKDFMIAAFSSSDSSEKEKLFAAAWRSLGETMHLLADMTVPAHVRNDSHPGIWWTELITDKYRADPYEAYVDQEVVNNHQGSADPGLIQAMNSIPEGDDGFLKVLNLFDIVAGYTNHYFFSLDTIAGVEKALGETLTNANGMPEYPSPRLEDLDDQEGYYYRNDYLGKLYLIRILYQEKQSFFVKTKYIPQPEIDERCILSQVERLIPAAIAGSEKLVEWFVPRLEVIIDSFVLEKDRDGNNTGAIKGRVVHTPNGIYDQPLLFTLPPDGKIQLMINGKPLEPPLGTISIQKGIIEGKIPSLPEEPIKEIGLLLDVGGIVVSSSESQIYSLQLHPDQLDGTVGEKYGFYVMADNSPSWVSYRWDFGDGVVEETENTSWVHAYWVEGEYQIQVQMKDSNTGKILAVARGKANILPQTEIPEETATIPPEPTLMIEPTPIEETPPPITFTPVPTPDEEAHRQQVLTEYRALYPQSLRAFHKFGRVEVIANAEEVGPDLYRVAYKLWQIIEDGPRKGEEVEAVSLDLNFNLGQLEADLVIMKKNLGIE